ncbi:MAG TPA: aldo/keto reductase [Methylomirabilota bacterium]|jgi:aryl-alcohol dehydrogenase-like predicted oxidoreductase|nr:aldo/keto reductase [Methylomirabilota bacterium]
MELRTLGRTGLRVSALGFGCGNVGGLMIRGAPAERERAVARALELGINYFDTAPSYGDGESERNLGQALRALKASAYVGTKFRLETAELHDIASAIARSLEASLRRLGMERVDLFQLHNAIARQRRDAAVAADDVLDAVVPALERLQRQGKTRFYGITATGETEALHRVIQGGVLHTTQVFYNLLNPSAGTAVPDGFPGQDFRRLLARARDWQLGVIVVRVLAGGALSGDAARHPVAVPTVEPIASGPDYATDVGRARRLRVLVEEGHAGDLVEAALRFPLASDAVSTVLLGYSSLQQLEHAAAGVAKGPLPPAALARLAALWRELGSGGG